MANNKTSKYSNLITSGEKPELFNQIPKKEISYEELEKVSQQHAGEIIRITKNLANTIAKVKDIEVALEKNHNEQKSISDLLVFSQWQAYFSQQEFFALKRWFWGFITIASLIIFGWIHELYFRFQDVKEGYVEKTKIMENLIDEYKRRNEKMEYEIKKENEVLKTDNENLKKELEYLRTRIDNIGDNLKISEK